MDENNTKIAISIPVHEKPDVIVDQILNIKTYCKNPIIVLHISKSFFDTYTVDSFQNIPEVYINPEHLDTKWGSIIHTHISNYFYIKDLVEFDYFIMHSSNDMYIKKGIEDYIIKYDAGFCRRKVLHTNTMWWVGNEAWKDQQLRTIMGKIGQNRIIGSQLEGSFYKKSLANNIMEILKENYQVSDGNMLGAEEIYFATIAECFVEIGKVGYPTTYSEVHVFDRTLWKVRVITRKLYRYFLRFFVSESNYYKIEDWYNDKMFQSRFYKINKRTINGIRRHDIKKKKCILNDYPAYFQLYDPKYVFSVKRIPRDYDDKIRSYIRNLKGESY